MFAQGRFLPCFFLGGDPADSFELGSAALKCTIDCRELPHWGLCLSGASLRGHVFVVGCRSSLTKFFQVAALEQISIGCSASNRLSCCLFSREANFVEL